ncbi:hypothetical protein MHU86_4243 [Fragilaria crotonensis]|nr:hypothetical protein MHU86_4243 [Fragilaria crotonensis]
MPSSSTATLLMAGSVVLAAAAASQFFPSGRSSNAGATEINDEDEDFIDQDLVCMIFDRLFLEMQAVVAQLTQQVQQIQMSGQHIPEAQLRKLLTAEFERALVARQAQVFEDHDVDADCLEEATWEFVANEELRVVRAVERFQKLYESISGQSVVGRRPGVKVQSVEAQVLDAQKTIAAATVYFAALSNVMKQISAEFQAEGKNLQDPTVAMAFQQQFATLANDAGDEALETMGLTMKDFQASVEANSQDPQVARSLTMLQMQQQKDLMEIGLVPSSM